MGEIYNILPPLAHWLGTPPPLRKAAAVVAGESWVSCPETDKLAKIFNVLAHKL